MDKILMRAKIATHFVLKICPIWMHDVHKHTHTHMTENRLPNIVLFLLPIWFIAWMACEIVQYTGLLGGHAAECNREMNTNEFPCG